MKTRQRKPARVAGRKSRTAPTAPVAASAALPPDTRGRNRPVIVATDGSEPAERAIRMARAMASRGDWSPEVITVCEPLPLAVGPVTLPELAAQEQLAMTNSVLQTIQRQLRRLGAAEWKVTVDYGRTAPHIIRAAREAKAELIVVGLGHHSAVARLFGAETAARIVRHSDIPVLAVHPSAGALPKLAVVALDFGDSSVRAAHEALALLDPPARLHLVHVKWGYNTTSLRDTDWDRAYHYGVEHGFDRIKNELKPPPGIDVTTDFVHGPVVKTILDIAKIDNADLIALGSHSQTVIDRLVIGSTPAEILRDAGCSVLIVPPVDARA